MFYIKFFVSKVTYQKVRVRVKGGGVFLFYDIVTLFTFVAKSSVHFVSGACSGWGERHAIMSTLLLSCSDFWSKYVSLLFRKGM